MSMEQEKPTIEGTETNPPVAVSSNQEGDSTEKDSLTPALQDQVKGLQEDVERLVIENEALRERVSKLAEMCDAVSDHLCEVADKLSKKELQSVSAEARAWIQQQKEWARRTERQRKERFVANVSYAQFGKDQSGLFVELFLKDGSRLPMRISGREKKQIMQLMRAHIIPYADK